MGFMNSTDTIQALEQGKFNTCLKAIYGEHTQLYQKRFINAVEAFRKEFDDGEIALFSAPFRMELGGNHTEHQGGCTLTSSIHPDMIGVAVKRDNHKIRLKSKGLLMDSVELSDLSPQPDEVNTSVAILRGIASGFTKMGCPVTGFDAYTISDIPCHTGFSSLATLEILVGNICSAFFAEHQVNAVRIAEIGQYAESNYFGRNSGLTNQLGCSVGGVIAVDFKNQEPVMTKISLNPEQEGYAVCLLDSHAKSHNLTTAYASIATEMRTIAKMFGKEKLSQISKSEFMTHFSGLRQTCGDRAVLRAMHFFAENARVLKQVQALEKQDFESYLAQVNASGHSSFQYLQNVCCYGESEKQEIAVIIALCEELLDGRGAVRVHGNGFTGTVQAYVPLDMLKSFRMQTEAVLGIGHCHVMQIRSLGGLQLQAD